MFTIEFKDLHGDWEAHRRFRTEDAARIAIAKEREMYFLGWRLTDGTGRVVDQLAA